MSFLVGWLVVPAITFLPFVPFPAVLLISPPSSISYFIFKSIIELTCLGLVCHLGSHVLPDQVCAMKKRSVLVALRVKVKVRSIYPFAVYSRNILLLMFLG